MDLEHMQKMNIWKEECRKKIIEPYDLQNKIDELRKQGKSIVTLNGSFDLLHAGHLHIIFEASKQADCLILALNSDESIQKYKSPSRPIIPLKYRLELMASISFIDYVTWFSEIDPRKLLEIIRPDVHVNGSEYGPNCIEADVVKQHGGKIYIVEKIPGLSTSEIITKVRQLCD